MPRTQDTTRTPRLTLYHPDAVSGTMILEDDTRIHWTEGRSSSVSIQYPDGRHEVIDAKDVGHWYWDLEPDGEGRDMTPDEVREHADVRNKG